MSSDKPFNENPYGSGANGSTPSEGNTGQAPSNPYGQQPPQQPASNNPYGANPSASPQPPAPNPYGQQPPAGSNDQTQQFNVGSQQPGGYGQQQGPTHGGTNDNETRAFGSVGSGYGQQPGGYGQQAGGYGQQAGGYGQPTGAQQPGGQYNFGAPGGPGAPGVPSSTAAASSGSNKTVMIVIGVIAAVAIAAIVAAFALLGGKDDPAPNPIAQPVPTSESAPTSEAAPSETESSAPSSSEKPTSAAAAPSGNDIPDDSTGEDYGSLIFDIELPEAMANQIDSDLFIESKLDKYKEPLYPGMDYGLKLVMKPNALDDPAAVIEGVNNMTKHWCFYNVSVESQRYSDTSLGVNRACEEEADVDEFVSVIDAVKDYEPRSIDQGIGLGEDYSVNFFDVQEGEIESKYGDMVGPDGVRIGVTFFIDGGDWKDYTLTPDGLVADE
ncbi:hypothetical protein QP027_07750 [Corynebacterium breve]|uniref:Uncharacterized protein n=1 Tax=Corynebacterium breve TaxID=3049799 RepID=A0ABY8VBH4_9CORY|nr:hypothetical protein [Corynebacterium breve]WIM67020.1 hypothetical protein QP027_07750 [Corynebacterium breve]